MKLNAYTNFILNRITPEYLLSQRWFLNKSARINKITPVDSWVIYKSNNYSISGNIIQIDFNHLPKKGLYFLPLIIGKRNNISNWSNNKKYFQVFFSHLCSNTKIKTAAGNIVKFRTPERNCRISNIRHIKEFTGELSNTIVFVDTFVVKTFRHLIEGTNPDLEVHLKLHKLRNSPIPKLYGYVSHINSKTKTEYVLAMIEEFVLNTGDCWNYILKRLKEFFSFVNTVKPGLSSDEKLKLVQEHLFKFRAEIKELARTIAILHYNLSKSFGSEPIRKSELVSWQKKFVEDFQYILKVVKEKKLTNGNFLQNNYEKIIQNIKKICKIKTSGKKTRIHSDLHLGQILKTPTSFCIIDFEGEPLLPPSEIRKKHSPLKDIAGMLRSFNYALNITYIQMPKSNVEFGTIWEQTICNDFLQEYFRRSYANKVDYLPKDEQSIKTLLACFQLQKAIYELKYEINSRPNWIFIPLEGIKKCIMELDRIK